MHMGSGGILPQKLDALRLILRPFWDRSWVVVLTWLGVYCIQFFGCPCMHLLTSNFQWGMIPEQQVGWQVVKENTGKRAYSLYDSKILQTTIIYRTFPCFFRWYDSRPFSCHYIVGINSLVWQLVNTLAPFIHWSSMNKHMVHRCSMDSGDSQW